MSFQATEARYESPIEERMGAALLAVLSERYANDDASEVRLVSQAGIIYRAELILKRWRPKRRHRLDFELALVRAGRRIKLGVECDGAAFHSDEAREDERDRIFFEEADTRIVHFTGKRIHASAQACADEAVSELERLYLSVDEPPPASVTRSKQACAAATEGDALEFLRKLRKLQSGI